MTKNTFSEVKKIHEVFFNKKDTRQKNNSEIIMERNNFVKVHKHYSYTRFSEFLRFENEFGLSSSFSELIFLELFSHNQIFFNFNLLLHQTMELLVSKLRISDVNGIIIRFFRITNWNLLNPGILLKFTSIYNSLIEAKGFLQIKESIEKKSYGDTINKEFFSVKMEKIRASVDNKSFLVSEILTNNLFRVNPWITQRNEEKRVFSEQLLRIVESNQNLVLLAKFYYIKFEYGYLSLIKYNWSKIYVFLSSVFHRLSHRTQSTSRIEKLLRTKIKILFKFDFFDFFKNNNLDIIKIFNTIGTSSGIIENLVLVINRNYFNKINKSFATKVIQENIQTIPRTYQSMIVSRIKFWLNIDERDIEYHILTYLSKERMSLSYDDLRGVLYFNLRY